jgi:hypothetical protein
MKPEFSGTLAKRAEGVKAISRIYGARVALRKDYQLGASVGGLLQPLQRLFSIARFFLPASTGGLD